jgi:integrase
MPKHTLTDRFCQSAKVAEGQVQTDWFDTETVGLALRVSGRSKTWNWLFSWGGKRQRMTLGTYPATSLAVARSRAQEARSALEAGKDPRSITAKPETFKAVCEEWITRKAGALRTGDQRKAALVRLVYPVLGDMTVRDIRRSDIVRLLDGIEDARGPAMADKTLSIVRVIFTWHANRSDDFYSPIIRGMARQSAHGQARARILTDDEIRTVWNVAGDQGAFGRMVRFLLLTGARRSEAAAMPWSEIEGSDWLLPASRNKTKVELLRPLSAAAMAELSAELSTQPYVFSNDGGATALCGFGALKADFDRATGSMGDRWTLHDLRRTARSLMSRAGVSSDHAERCLGHVISGVRGIYDRHEYRDEKARAYGLLSALINRIVNPQPNVVPINSASRLVSAVGD